MLPSESYRQINSTIPQHVTLIAVSKNHSSSAIKDVYHAGCRDFGENKVQELIQKNAELPEDIKWHMIGHLQTNKVKYIVPFTYLIHSVDSIKLLLEINKEASKIGKIQNCLIQFHIAKEETKYGFSLDEANTLFNMELIQNCKNISICGVMGMASFTDDELIIRNEFRSLKHMYESFKKQYNNILPHFNQISMGMSSDFHIAIEEGSTMVRIGSTIFGQRNYSNI